jgi:hypothetical protein
MEQQVRSRHPSRANRDNKRVRQANHMESQLLYRIVTGDVIC